MSVLKEGMQLKGKQALIFFHIGKTAGTTLNTILKRNFPAESIYSMNGGENSRCSLELKTLPDENKLKIKYLHAHSVSFGTHKDLPQDSVYITFLRHPVDRVISAYRYILRDDRHPLYQKFTSQEFSLHDFVLTRTGDIESRQTRMLSGINGLDAISGDGPLNPSVFEAAKNNLIQHFKVVGLTERFDESLILLRRFLGWRIKDILYVKSKVAPNSFNKKNIPAETIELLEKYNQVDFELYEFAKKKFLEQIRRQGVCFWLELFVFRLYNRFYVFKIRNRIYSNRQLLRFVLRKTMARLTSLLRMVIHARTT